MKYILFLYCFFPVLAFAQPADKYAPLPFIEKSLQAVFTDNGAKYVNITDSVMKLFPHVENVDTTYTDSLLYKASYTKNKHAFTFYIKAYWSVDAEISPRINRHIKLTITHNNQVVLKDFTAYEEEYVESYAQESHCFLVKGDDGLPGIAKAIYAYREFVENDAFDCKQCELWVYADKKYTQAAVNNCNEMLKTYSIPFSIWP